MAKTVPGGAYLTFEGPDGCGKSTQLALLADALEAEGWRVVRTKEPGGTAVGVAIRQVLLHKEYADAMLPKTESLLFWADRLEHHERIVKPALEAGCVVLGDRDFDSSWAYQHYGRGIDGQWMAAAQQLVMGAFRPHKTFLFDGPVAALLTRSLRKNAAAVSANGEAADESRFEQLDTRFHERLAAGFLERAAKEPERFVRFDAMRDSTSLHKDVLAAAQAVLSAPDR